MKVLPIAYQKQWGVNYSINDKRRDFMSDNNKKVEEKAAEIIQATETQTVKPAAAEDKEFKKRSQQHGKETSANGAGHSSSQQ